MVPGPSVAAVPSGVATEPGGGDAYIGIDVGGTSVRGVVTGYDGRCVASLRAPTPATVRDLEQALVAMIDQLRRESGAVAVGLAVAGFVAADRRRVMTAPHLPWRDAPVAETLAARCGVPVMLDHDVNCAAWAEYRRGAAVEVARRDGTALVIALGTGIGCGLVSAGRLYRGAHGIAPELGHIVVVRGGRECACGKAGCLERYCSGTALVDDMLERMRAGVRTTLSPRGLTGRAVAAAAGGGDAAAQAVMAGVGRWFGRAMAIAADMLDPELIVLAGGMVDSAPLFLDTARASFAAEATRAAERPLPQVVVARFGSDAGAIGAALLAAEEFAAGA